MVAEPNEPQLAPTTEQLPRRVLIIGAGGDLGGEKLTPGYCRLQERGVEIYACDILPESAFRPKFTGFSGYFNLSNVPDRERLRSVGNVQKFDLLYDATWPDSHLLDVLDWQSICSLIIVTKPFVAIEQYQTLRALMEIQSYRSVVAKLLLHDHYINKPSLESVIASLPQAHSRYGKFARVVMIITERRTVNDEYRRLRALTGGMIPDLDSHAVMALQRLVPVGLVWEDEEGNRIRRLAREIEATACVRAQMKNAMCRQDVDTACIVEYRVIEHLSMIADGDIPVGDPIENTFYVLVVCAKGLRATDDIDRDLKAIEISFQGQGQSTGIIDLETNAVNEVLQAVPGLVTPDNVLRRHRGINRPIFDLLDQWDRFASQEGFRLQLFQPPMLVWENVKLLWQTLGTARKGLLPAYGHRDLIHNFVNTHIGPSNGFHYFGHEGSGWPTKEPGFNLLRGHVPSDKIA